ncbi:MAG TPA: PP2C family protein-serine/threonine phosphatase, partial [Acidimicrobiales bacterium]
DGVDGVDGHGEGRRWARAGDGRRRRGGTTDVVLRDPEGQRRGVLLVHRWGPPAPDPARDALQATVAELVGQTLERVALHEGEHAVVAALQRRLLPPAPAVAGLDVAVHYQPASGEVGMGGDWYDAIVLEDGSLVVVLGDVTGHGVDAVASMAQLQYLIAGLVRTGTPLSRIFAQANAMLGDEDTFATAQLIHVDHRWHRMGHLSAGHPPVLLRRPDGEVQVVTDARQSLIGVPLEPQPLAYVPCPPGSLVLAYTDGLIERRGRPITAGVDVLAADLAGASPDTPADGLLRQIVERARRPDASGAALDDDIAAVLIRVVT